jgi:hypothetical protein
MNAETLVGNWKLVSWQVVTGRFAFIALRRRALVCLPLALERRRMAYPKAQDYACFQRGLQKRIAIGEMVFNDQLALQKILNGPCPLLGCSLIPGARWQDWGRRQSRRFGDMADGFSV